MKWGASRNLEVLKLLCISGFGVSLCYAPLVRNGEFYVLRHTLRREDAPVIPVFSSQFLNKYKLAQGMIQKALHRLSQLDLIEKIENNQWKVIDPIFQNRLKR